MSLKRGDRCRLTREAVQLVGRRAAQTGIILRESARGEWVVQFDERKTPQYWHKDFIKPDDLAVPNGDSQVDDILKRALADAKDKIPSEEITYSEMMENLAHARRLAEKKGDPNER